MKFLPDADIFAMEADVIINPVNCHVHKLQAGWQKGLAGAFETRFPGSQAPLRNACAEGKMRPGMVQPVRVDRATGEKSPEGDMFVLNVATKDHWKNPSRMEWVDDGLRKVAEFVQVKGLKSVAIPKLGAGLGRLTWEDVREKVVHHFGPLAAAGVNVMVLGEGPEREVGPRSAAARRLEIARPEGTRFVAGIGARDTPAPMLEKLRDIGTIMAKAGCVLRSGGADGADKFCEDGWDAAGGEKEIFLSWDGMNDRRPDNNSVFAFAYKDNDPEAVIARSYYHRTPAKPDGDAEKWARLGRGGRSHMTRNTNQMLGPNPGHSPQTDLVLCWTKNGQIVGGTGQALRIAQDKGVPILNLGDPALRGLSVPQLADVGLKMIDGVARDEAIKEAWNTMSRKSQVSR